MPRLIDELKTRYPTMAKRAARSPLAAIRLFCMECCGGNRADVRRCPTTECILHRFRDGHRPGDKAEGTEETAGTEQNA